MNITTQEITQFQNQLYEQLPKAALLSIPAVAGGFIGAFVVSGPVVAGALGGFSLSTTLFVYITAVKTFSALRSLSAHYIDLLAMFAGLSVSTIVLLTSGFSLIGSLFPTACAVASLAATISGISSISERT